MALTREQVVTVLRTVQDPEIYKDIVTLNLVREIHIDGGLVAVLIEPTHPNSPGIEQIKRGIDAALRTAGATEVRVIVGGGQTAPAAAPAGAPRGGPTPPPRQGDGLPQVKNIIAVGAGKGGVGKSTVALNLAVGLARTGARVALMDGDIYGPSMPTMLHLKGMPLEQRGHKLVPFFVHGIHCVTIGSLVEEDKPLIWRGPMAHGAFKQLLVDNTDWPELDYMIVDLPPGTGDVSLTLHQIVRPTGAVIVATPQQVALDDAVRALRMFQQLGSPVLGIVENMRGDIFGSGGAEMAAQRLGVPFLGAISAISALRANSDAGDPTANFTGDPRLKEELETIVRNVASRVSVQNMKAPGPQLTVS